MILKTKHIYKMEQLEKFLAGARGVFSEKLCGFIPLDRITYEIFNKRDKSSISVKMSHYDKVVKFIHNDIDFSKCLFKLRYKIDGRREYCRTLSFADGLSIKSEYTVNRLVYNKYDSSNCGVKRKFSYNLN